MHRSSPDRISRFAQTVGNLVPDATSAGLVLMLIVAGAALAFGTRPGAIADACGQTLRFVGTAEDGKAQSWSVPLFECRMHGSLYLTTEGLRREPPATRP